MELYFFTHNFMTEFNLNYFLDYIEFNFQDLMEYYFLFYRKLKFHYNLESWIQVPRYYKLQTNFFI